MFPRIAISGTPGERGRQYGEQARARVARSIEIYADAFMHRSQWSWDRVREEAERFVPRIAVFGASYLEEMRGIAAGAKVDLLDVVALNVRTEIFYRGAECTSFALPDPGGGDPLIGQNWDWLAATRETVVVIEARCEGSPSYVTVAEAGLLAKVGVNSAGVALLANALATNESPPDDGIPFHLLLRAVLDQTEVADAVELLRSTVRGSSANYLIAGASGAAIDLEAEPGGRDRIHEISASNGVIIHTNHFLSPGFQGRDETLVEIPDSLTRLQRLRQLASEETAPLDAKFLMRALADHDEYPVSICAHHDPKAPTAEQWATIASIVIDLPGRKLLVAPGNPCETEFEELALGDLLGRPAKSSRVVAHP